MSTVFDGVQNDDARTAVHGLVAANAVTQVGNRPEHPFLPVRSETYYTSMDTSGLQYQLAKLAYETWVALLQSLNVDFSQSPLAYATSFASLESNVRIFLLREIEFHLTMGGRISPEMSHLYWLEAAIQGGWVYNAWREDPVSEACTANNATETFTDTANGLAIGDIVYIEGDAVPAGITRGKAYYVLTTPNANDFTLSASPGGATAAFTTNGTNVTWNQPGATPKVVDTANMLHHLLTDWRNVPREMRLRAQVVDALLYNGLLSFKDRNRRGLGISYALETPGDFPTTSIPAPHTVVGDPMGIATNFAVDNRIDVLAADLPAAGSLIRFIGADLPDPLEEDTTYWVREIISATEFTISTQPNGEELVFADDGSGDQDYVPAVEAIPRGQFADWGVIDVALRHEMLIL